MQYDDGLDNKTLMVTVSLEDLESLRAELSDAKFSVSELQRRYDNLLINYRGLSYAAVDLLQALRPEDGSAPNADAIDSCTTEMWQVVCFGSSKEDVEARDKAASGGV